jgi:hypothetical protein
MPDIFHSVTSTPLPSQSAILSIYQSTNLQDSFLIQLPKGTSNDPESLARFIFSQQPAWIAWLTKIRDILVAVVGLKTAKHLASLAADAKANRLGIFKIFSKNETEIVFGEDDNHLDFRLSVLCLSGATNERDRRLFFSTVVHCHNRLGRVYIFIIAPFHRMVVKASLLRAARVGWPMGPGA